ncbi:hypothetical protein HG530_002251 [Fusarium avenaceum]|nr:hypothetical protein HG530_002251 [Fusarium avenaceum]
MSILRRTSTPAGSSLRDLLSSAFGLDSLFVTHRFTEFLVRTTRAQSILSLTALGLGLLPGLLGRILGPRRVGVKGNVGVLTRHGLVRAGL